MSLELKQGIEICWIIQISVELFCMMPDSDVTYTNVR